MAKIKKKISYPIDEALTPLDGRNRHKIKNLIPYFSEAALLKYRIFIELEYLKALSAQRVIRHFSRQEHNFIASLPSQIHLVGGVGEIENKTNHDMKAVELYLQMKLCQTSLKDIAPMIHFGLTADDINNIAYALMIKDACRNVLIGEIEKIEKQLITLILVSKNIPMLGRTHGQPAAPTTLGKELLVFARRLQLELNSLKKLNIKAKITGNTGNLNVHKTLFTGINWLKFSQDFIESLGLIPDIVTTQIEPYDSIIVLFQNLIRINNILLGLCVDLWQYIMLGYFQQTVVEKEVGSTALPHKVNPIYLEGAEGGFGIANALLEFYCRKLSYSRLQRDLSDSTIRRSFGIAIAYALLSYQSVLTGLSRITPNKKNIQKDLMEHWEVLSEPIQNFLRFKGKTGAYEQTKQFFRGRIIDKSDVRHFILSLDLSETDKKMLLDLTPQKYTGYAEEITNLILKQKL